MYLFVSNAQPIHKHLILLTKTTRDLHQKTPKLNLNFLFIAFSYCFLDDLNLHIMRHIKIP